jgi:hypothetical protein
MGTETGLMLLIRGKKFIQTAIQTGIIAKKFKRDLRKTSSCPDRKALIEKKLLWKTENTSDNL